MTLTVALLLVVAGLVLLAVGGEALVRAATTLAELAGVSPAVIGLTVVAIGTSLPELVVSVVAAQGGQPDLAIANVVGSNIFNIAATLGLTALLIPLPVHGAAVRLEWPVMFVASALLMLVARDGTIGRVDGVVFLMGLVFFVAYTVRVARRNVSGSEAATLAAEVESRDIDSPTGGRPKLLVPLAVLAAGVVALVIGGRMLVDGAVAVARIAGMSERVIGLTIVAGGTGAPELATSMMAAYRRRTDIAIANMIGSNIFNVLGILGLTTLVQPVPVSREMLAVDLWWMLGTSLLLLPLLYTGKRLSRIEGGVLVAAYGAYLVILLR